MRCTILGSGTSSGVPLIGCRCATCTSSDPRDTRTRTSVLIREADSSIAIDTSSDFRQQMLRHDVRQLDAVLYTHHHFDHIAGFDDLRAFNFLTRRPMALYATEITFANIRRMFSYAFGVGTTPGTATPMVTPHEITAGTPFLVGGIEVIPVPLTHGSMEVLGFRIGSFAYCTDCNGIPPAGREMLRNLDMLVLDALRYSPHPTHFSLEESLAVIADLKPRQALLTHIAHEMKHDEASAKLPANVAIAVDGMELEI